MTPPTIKLVQWFVCDPPAPWRCKSFYSGCCRLLVPDDLTAFMTHHAVAPFAMSSCLSPCLLPWRRGVRLQVGGADLTCARSIVRQLASSVRPVDRLCQVGHVSGPAVRGCDDLTARTKNVIFRTPTERSVDEATDSFRNSTSTGKIGF
ncbi:hypothetical protein GW17_00045712 [Ensete ventricosum]|nr:hypothetical protein GW17_00045712 [Ensete ventricosum]